MLTWRKSTWLLKLFKSPSYFEDSCEVALKSL